MPIEMTEEEYQAKLARAREMLQELENARSWVSDLLAEIDRRGYGWIEDRRIVTDLWVACRGY